MKVGTKTAAIAICSFIIGGSLVGSYYASVQVPKLNAQIRVLEQDVADQKRINSIIMSEKNSVTKEKKSLIKKLEHSENQVQKLVSKLDEEKALEGFEVTWYNDEGITKSGRKTEDGVTVAVDPNIIPLGTWIRIVFEDGRTITRRADDTGGAVKGKVVDIYKDSSTKTLLEMGRKFNVKVYILDKGA